MHNYVALALSHTLEIQNSNFKISNFSTLLRLVTTDLGGIGPSFMHHIVALALLHKKEVKSSDLEGFEFYSLCGQISRNFRSKMSWNFFRAPLCCAGFISHFRRRKFEFQNFGFLRLVNTDVGGIGPDFMHHFVALALFHKKEVEKSDLEGF